MGKNKFSYEKIFSPFGENIIHDFVLKNFTIAYNFEEKELRILVLDFCFEEKEFFQAKMVHELESRSTVYKVTRNSKEGKKFETDCFKYESCLMKTRTRTSLANKNTIIASGAHVF